MHTSLASRHDYLISLVLCGDGCNILGSHHMSTMDLVEITTQVCNNIYYYITRPRRDERFVHEKCAHNQNDLSTQHYCIESNQLS